LLREFSDEGQKSRVEFISEVFEVILQKDDSEYTKNSELKDMNNNTLLKKGDRIDTAKRKELYSTVKRTFEDLKEDKRNFLKEDKRNFLLRYPILVRVESKFGTSAAERFPKDSALEDRAAAQEAIDLSKDQKHVLLKVAANQLGKPVPVLATEEPSEGEEKLEKRTRDSLRRLAKLQEPPNSGINRVEELFEARKPKGEAITVDYEGEVVDIIRSVGRWVVIKATLPVGDLLVGKMSLQTIEDPKSGTVILEEMEEIRTAHLTRLLDAGVQAVTVTQKKKCKKKK
jgi:hypothetical protein